LSDLPVRAGRISPIREVPSRIPKPDYAVTGQPKVESSSPIAQPGTIARIRRASQLAKRLLDEAAALVDVGVTSEEIDAFLHRRCIEEGAYPSTLNYKGYPKSSCISVNEVICHGIPDSRALCDGDIVNIDITVFLDGVHGDVDATYPVGVVHPDHLQLIQITRECCEKGIAAVTPGNPISDIGRAIEAHASRFGYSVVRAFSGHGIGELFHNGLSIPHYYDPAYSTVMRPGMVLTVEPMIAAGTWRHRIWPDGWTAVTADLSRTAQFEHTVVVTEDGVEVLTT
jgi:methionyl aminopeptidase